MNLESFNGDFIYANVNIHAHSTNISLQLSSHILG